MDLLRLTHPALYFEIPEHQGLQIFPGVCPERKISRHFAPRNDRKRRGRNDKSMGFRPDTI